MNNLCVLNNYTIEFRCKEVGVSNKVRTTQLVFLRYKNGLHDTLVALSRSSISEYLDLQSNIF
jgi:hypothetical protein